MRPLQLTIEGLRSFRKSESFDFTGRDSIAIVGDTGAGKSSILEAMTYALYGKTSFAGRKRELMNANETRMRVIFRFRVSDATWEVVRSARRGKSGDLTSPIAELSRVSEDGTRILEVENVTPVDERVKGLLGLDCDAFLRTVILPQGRFARLLVEDRPADRSLILRQVWRTDELEAAGRAAKEALESVRLIQAKAKATADGYPEDPEARLEHLKAAQDAAIRRAESAKHDELEANEAGRALRAAQKDEDRASGVRPRLDMAGLDQVQKDLVKLAERERLLDRKRRILEQRREKLETKRGQIPTGDGPSRKDVTTALVTLRRLGDCVDSAEKTATDLRTCVKTASEKCAEAKRQDEGAGAARKRDESHAAAQSRLKEALRSAKEQVATVKKSYEQWTACSASRDAAEKRLAEQQRKSAAHLVDLQEAQESSRQAQGEVATAEEHLAAVRRSDAAATAAHDLHPGHSCPVCRRALPADWEAPAGTGLPEAERAARAVRDKADTAARRITGLDSKLWSTEERIGELRADVAHCESQVAAARRRLAHCAGLATDGSPPERSILLAPLEDAQRRAEADFDEHEKTAVQLRDKATGQNAAAQQARQDAEYANRETNKARESAASAVAELSKAIGAVPDAYRPALPLPAEAAELQKVDTGPITRQTKLAEARDAELEKRQQKRDCLSARIDEAEDSLQELEEQRQKELETPLQNLADRLRKWRDVLRDSAGELGLDREIAHAPAADAEALETHARDLLAAGTEIANAAERRATKAADRAEAERTRLRALGERLDVPSDDPNAVCRAVRQRAEEARHEERTAGKEKERFAAIADDIRRLRTLLDQTRRKEDALSDLAEALNPGQFLKWLTLKRSERLLRYASQKLEEVSDGRYSFVDPQQTDEQWRILDNESNQPRSPASLSGGEQFLASLALALGMVEMMERTGGRLESLFFDEGFGSLDPHFLDHAIEALKSAAEKRLVVVISHVPAVAEQIEHVLAVTREATGSRAVWLSAPERERLAAADAQSSILADFPE